MPGLLLLAATCYLEMLDKLQKRICKTVGPLLAASVEFWTYRRNITSLNLFYSISLVDVHLNWLN